MDDFRLVGERILDLSPKGMLLACDEEMKLGQEVLASFRSPFLGPDVVVLGVVTRVIEGWRLGDPGYCVGIRFIEMESEYAHELSERLRQLPTVPGSRRYPADYASSVQAVAQGYC